MPNIETTFEEILKHKPCDRKPGSNMGWDKLTTTLNRDTGPVTLQEILDSNGVADAYWALCCWPVETYAIVRAKVADSVYYIWHERYPEDTTIRACIDGWYRLAKGGISVEQIKFLKKAAHASASSYAASSYASAAYVSAHASYALAYASAAAASVSAYNYAFVTPFASFALEKQWEKNKEILEEFICQT